MKGLQYVILGILKPFHATTKMAHKALMHTNSNIGFRSSLGHIQKLGIASQHASRKRP